MCAGPDQIAAPASLGRFYARFSAAASRWRVTANNQGELDPLEIGIHVFKTAPPEKGGKGKKGGLSEYARLVGKKQPYIHQLRNAEEVVTSPNVLVYRGVKLRFPFSLSCWVLGTGLRLERFTVV
jgi:hypothetical protein